MIEAQKRGSGRNNQGRITVRHQGGGHKRFYRVIDFKRDKDGILGEVERLEYDPNRSAYIALVLYEDGERRYIIAPKDLKVGDEVMSGVDAPIKIRKLFAVDVIFLLVLRYALYRNASRKRCTISA